MTLDIQKCPNCKSKNLIRDYDTGELVCADCGFVIDDKLMDSGPEWRAYTDEEKNRRSRVGSPQTFTIHDHSLSTIIGKENIDRYGRPLKPEQKAQINRLRKLQKRTRISSIEERTIAAGLPIISKIGNHLHLSHNVIETASVNFRKAVKGGIVRGRTTVGVAAASVYLACKQCEISRTLDEIVKVCLNIGELNDNYKSKIRKRIHSDYRTLIEQFEFYNKIKFVPPKKYGNRISNQLSLSGKTEGLVYKILEEASRTRLTAGRNPVGVVASAAYLASVITGERRTQREIAKKTGITEVTIRNRSKELVENLMFITYL